MDMSDEPNRCGEDVAPYALGALPPDDARAFERHLAECDLCRTDLDALRPVVHALSETPEPVDPPPELRKRLMAVVEQEAAERRRAERSDRADRADRAERGERRPGLLRRLPRPMPALAAACVVLVVGIGIGIGLTGDGGRTFDPDSAPPGVQAELTVEDDGGELVVQGMDSPPAGKVMQVWVVHGENGEPEPTDALFRPNRAGDASVAVPGDMKGVTRVMVSEEPEGGSMAPTTEPSVDFRLS
jgi:anti-sigma-K factor RskA